MQLKYEKVKETVIKNTHPVLRKRGLVSVTYLELLLLLRKFVKALLSWPEQSKIKSNLVQ